MRSNTHLPHDAYLYDKQIGDQLRHEIEITSVAVVNELPGGYDEEPTISFYRDPDTRDFGIEVVWWEQSAHPSAPAPTQRLLFQDRSPVGAILKWCEWANEEAPGIFDDDDDEDDD